MKKGFKKLFFLIVFILIIIPNTVHAEDCSEVDKLVNEYSSLKQEYDANKCGTFDSVKSNKFEECINNGTKLDAMQEELATIYNTDSQCKDHVADVIKNTNCEPLLSDLFPLFQEILDYIYILAPILLIIFVGIDIFKILTSSSGGFSSNNDGISKIRTNIFKRFIAFLLVYLTPTIVAFIVSFNNTPYKLMGDLYVCEKTNTLGSTVHDALKTFFDIISGEYEDENFDAENVLSGAEAIDNWTTTIRNYYETGDFSVNEDSDNGTGNGNGTGNDNETTETEETGKEEEPNEEDEESSTEDVPIIDPGPMR